MLGGFLTVLPKKKKKVPHDSIKNDTNTVLTMLLCLLSKHFTTHNLMVTTTP